MSQGKFPASFTLAKAERSVERPAELLEDLLRETGIDPGKRQRDRDVETSLHLEASGRVGTPSAGFRWRERRATDTNADIDCSLETYGLPGIELRWLFNLHKSGYGYRFENGTLSVRFADAAARARFERLWQRRWGHLPQLSASP